MKDLGFIPGKVIDREPISNSPSFNALEDVETTFNLYEREPNFFKRLYGWSTDKPVFSTDLSSLESYADVLGGRDDPFELKLWYQGKSYLLGRDLLPEEIELEVFDTLNEHGVVERLNEQLPDDPVYELNDELTDFFNDLGLIGLAEFYTLKPEQKAGILIDNFKEKEKLHLLRYIETYQKLKHNSYQNKGESKTPLWAKVLGVLGILATVGAGAAYLMNVSNTGEEPDISAPKIGNIKVGNSSYVEPLNFTHHDRINIEFNASDQSAIKDHYVNITSPTGNFSIPMKKGFTIPIGKQGNDFSFKYQLDEVGNYSFTPVLIDKNDNLANTTLKILSEDNPPTIDLAKVKIQERLGRYAYPGEPVRLLASVEDDTFDHEKPEVVAVVKSIFGSYQIPLEPGGSLYTGEFNHTGIPGEYDVLFKAVDEMNQTSTATESFVSGVDIDLSELKEMGYKSGFFEENPFLWEYINDGELDEYEKNILVESQKLGELHPFVLRTPEVYSKEIDLEDITNYVNFVEKIQSIDDGAAQWVLETGLFLEDKDFSNLEQKFVDESLDKSDLLRLYVANFVMDGIQNTDLSQLKRFNPPTDGALGYLTDDLQSLPEILDGINETEQEAINELSRIVNASKEDYQLRKGIYLMDEYGVPDQNLFSFSVPGYNTQLQVLLHLAEDRDIPKDYYRIALASGLDYGSVVTIGDNEVDQEVRSYVPQIFDFIKKTDKMLREELRNGVWQAKNYPLEANIGLVWRNPGQFYPNFKSIVDKTNWSVWNWHYIYSGVMGEPQSISDFEYFITDLKTVKEAQEFMIKKFVGLEKSPELNMPYKDMQKKYPFCYKTPIDQIASDLDDYFYVNSEHIDTDVPEKIFINDKTIVGGARTVFNTNWQWERFKDTSKILGSCMDNAHVGSFLLKSINIPAMIGDLGHAFPSYYDPKEKTWKTNPYEQNIILSAKTYSALRGYTWGSVPWNNWKSSYAQCKSIEDRFSPGVDTDARFKLFYRLASDNHAKWVYPKAWSTGIPVGYTFRQIPFSEENRPYDQK